FDFGIQNVLNRPAARIGQDRPVSQSAGSPFHPTLEPADDFFVSDCLGGPLQEFAFVPDVQNGTSGIPDFLFLPIDEAVNFLFARVWTQISREERSQVRV